MGCVTAAACSGWDYHVFKGVKTFEAPFDQYEQFALKPYCELSEVIMISMYQLLKMALLCHIFVTKLPSIPRLC